jgi:peroxiredoxin
VINHHPPYQTAPVFSATTQDDVVLSFGQLSGEHGLLLTFVSEIWLAATATQVRWLQQVSIPLLRKGIRAALVACNEPHTLKMFYDSCLVHPLFPLIADPDRLIHAAFGVTNDACAMLLDRNMRIRGQWGIDETANFPSQKRFLRAVDTLKI